MTWLRVVAWALLCALSGPLWVAGFALAWLHRYVNGAAVLVIRWAFWEPTQRVWRGLVRSYHMACVAEAAEDPDTVRKVNRDRFLARARRGRRGVR